MVTNPLHTSPNQPDRNRCVEQLTKTVRQPMTYASYVRSSTADQTDTHQRDSISAWFDEHDVPMNDVDQYADIGSGADDSREQFNELLDGVEGGRFSHVVCWEISRISRRGATLQEFFDLCSDTDTTIIITDGAVERIEPDGQGRFVADVIGMVYQQERRTLIRRIEAGQRRARDQGKWLGQLPAGFRRDGEGFLVPILNPAHDDGEIGYLEVRSALKQIDNGASYRSLAKELPITRQGLSKIHQDDERRSWYLDGEAADDRVDDALEQVRPLPTDVPADD